MKKVDSIVLKSFIIPLLVTFFITDFIFLLQFLWKYIDDLVGKGLENRLIIKLTVLYAITIIPLALPLAVLLSSTMVLGNMGEYNELVSFKSSGVSLLRTMRSLILFVCLLSIGAYYFSNQILPVVHLKFFSLLYDIRKHKPALDIKEGVFYNGIEGFNIRLKSKAEDDQRIYGITVYDHTDGRGNTNVTMADSGQLVASPDGRYLIMTLYSGKQYREMNEGSKSDKELFERTEMDFHEWRKVFDLASFEIKRTDESIFKDHYHMLNTKQLSAEIDTLKDERDSRIGRAKSYHNSYLAVRADQIDITENNIVKDTLLLDTISAVDFVAAMHSESRRIRAIQAAESLKSYSGSTIREMDVKNYLIARHKMEWHRKFTLSLACIILLFIGGPMGAIVRKGGFGFPLLIAVLFFLLFHVLTITGEKLSKEMVLQPFYGMWLPCLVLSIIGMFLTYKAATDSPIMREEWYGNIRDSVKLLFTKKSRRIE